MVLINILLVDDHMLFAKSLSIALEEYKEIEQFYSTQDIHNLSEMIQDKKIDIVLMDINLRGLSECDGLKVAYNLLETNSTSIRILALIV